MSEGVIDANALARVLKERVNRAEIEKMVIPPGEFKVIDIDPDKSDNKWTVIGSDPTLPIDMEISANASPETPLIAIQGSPMDRSVLAIRFTGSNHIQIKPLSKLQTVDVEELDSSRNVIKKYNIGPKNDGFEQRHNISLQNNQAAMLYLGPARYPIRVFAHSDKERQAIRLVLNPKH